MGRLFCQWPRLVKDGRQSHPLHRLWGKVKSRCYNRNNAYYHCYGGRGIRMCTKWYVDFWAFVQDIEALGPKPDSSYSLDRVDNNGNYEPGNIRWAGKVAQSHNSRCVLLAKGYRKHPIAGYDVRIMRNGISMEIHTKTESEAIDLVRRVRNES